jgi:hypothetical protein
MEVVIPLFALSGLYIINNQSKNKSISNKNNQETFTNHSDLPNVDLPNVNYPNEYPVVNPESTISSQLSTNNGYDGKTVYTDKYFNSNVKSSIVNPYVVQNQNANPLEVSPKYFSMTGEQVDSEYFQHNNMVPFFGSKSRSYQKDANSNEGLLDHYAGSGSQIISKKEQNPLFAPNENSQWAYGMPSQSDFIQSRVNPSMRMANVNPFQEPNVAPGLGMGPGSQGGDGFNSGMMAREQWLPKTADEMRVANKPKASGTSLFGHEGPANSYVKYIATAEQMGVVEKNRPERAFEMGQDRLFTTTGIEKGPALRPIPVESVGRYVSRPETNMEYNGVAVSHIPGTYTEGEYMETHRQQWGDVPMGIANANGKGYAVDEDYEKRAKMAYPNNRTANQQDNYFGLVSGSLGAVVAPLLDMLRPSRKENTVGTLRPYQNARGCVPKSYIFNPNDKLNTTIRETTENSKFHMNINANQNGGAYKVTEKQLKDTYRQETSDHYYVGGSSANGSTQKSTSYMAGYNQRNNDIKSSTIDGRLVGGNMKLMNSDITIKQNTRDDLLKNNRHVSGTMPYQGPDVNNMGRVAGNSGNQLYQGIQMDRNTPDMMENLKSNPYITDYKNAL